MDRVVSSNHLLACRCINHQVVCTIHKDPTHFDPNFNVTINIFIFGYIKIKVNENIKIKVDENIKIKVKTGLALVVQYLKRK